MPIRHPRFNVWLPKYERHTLRGEQFFHAVIIPLVGSGAINQQILLSAERFGEFEPREFVNVVRRRRSPLNRAVCFSPFQNDHLRDCNPAASNGG